MDRYIEFGTNGFSSDSFRVCWQFNERLGRCWVGGLSQIQSQWMGLAWMAERRHLGNQASTNNSWTKVLPCTVPQSLTSPRSPSSCGVRGSNHTLRSLLPTLPDVSPAEVDKYRFYCRHASANKSMSHSDLLSSYVGSRKNVWRNIPGILSICVLRFGELDKGSWSNLFQHSKLSSATDHMPWTLYCVVGSIIAHSRSSSSKVFIAMDRAPMSICKALWVCSGTTQEVWKHYLHRAKPHFNIQPWSFGDNIWT